MSLLSYILFFGLPLTAALGLVSSGVAYLCTFQWKKLHPLWRLAGYLVFTLLYAALFYNMFGPPFVGCDFRIMGLPFIIPAYILSIILCHLFGRSHRKRKQQIDDYQRRFGKRG